ncbi:pyridoxamine 5'-phosphate oxidase [Terrabacter tumescens]|uniref:Pyridoxamine 5'-phosphate oxidase n=1 Tax=Terrabacter tumescens TaxID=60443 RepID=A0ABQ2HWU3_9MICO|nr:pyridoxamine 5'-phosphate oxidase [Terrabacter tumescens]
MKLHESIDGRLRAFIERQHLFFVATAPLSRDGHVNVSPKGLDGSFVVLDERTVAYLDLTGSGSETVAHLRENGRITVMFCAFEGAPNIVRLHGKGRYVGLQDSEFDSYRRLFPDIPGARGVVVVDVERVSDSCGYAVPLMTHDGDRDLLTRWADNRGDEGLATYRATKNAASIDGLPALDATSNTTPDATRRNPRDAVRRHV